MRGRFVLIPFLLAGSVIGPCADVTAVFLTSPESRDTAPIQTMRQPEEFSDDAQVAPSNQTSDIGTPDLLVSWVCQGTHWGESPNAAYTRGIVKNVSLTELTDIVAEVVFIRSQGDLLGMEEAMLDDADLPPGKISSFFVFLPADGQTTRCSVSFRNSTGPLTAVRATALKADTAYPFVGRWIGSNGKVALDFFRDGTAFMVTDQGIALGAGSYRVSDPGWVELSLSIPPEGMEPGYLYWHDQWRALSGTTKWRYVPSRDMLSLLTSEEQIFLTRGLAPGIAGISESSREASADIVLEVQKRLKKEGLDPGPLDGIFGDATRAALGAFQDSRKLKQTRELDEATLSALGLARPKRDLEKKRPGEAR